MSDSEGDWKAEMRDMKPKAFYTLCNDRIKSPKTTPSGLIDSKGTVLLTNEEKCLAFSSFFSSAFAVPQQSPLPLPSPSLIFDLSLLEPLLYGIHCPPPQYHLEVTPSAYSYRPNHPPSSLIPKLNHGSIFDLYPPPPHSPTLAAARTESTTSTDIRLWSTLSHLY
ncbi:hypothetical protein PRIPAC_86759, partial [Pristionchus pacificus]|uniref:Uncharacterized protein n=1 Tax=Pristionchus pacificus TaxID=54126 RepID=A0A2A6BVK9_PRIPA